MSVEQQYIDLFRQARPTIDSHSAPLLNVARYEAFARFEQLGFPVYGSENYQRTDLPTLFSPDYGLNLTQIQAAVDTVSLFHCDVPNLSTLLYFLVNDTFVSPRDLHTALPEGVIVCGLREASTRFPDKVAPYYDRLAKDSDDGTVAFNTTFTQDGLFVYIPRGIIVPRPIQLVNILSGKVNMMANRRILVVAEPDSEVRLLVCDHTADDTRHYLVTQVAELYAGANSRINFYELEESSLQTKRIASTFVRQETSSDVQINCTTIHNGTSRNNYVCLLDGPGAELSLTGIAIVDGDQRIDNRTDIRHNVPHCTSNELFKYVVDDRAQGTFAGLVYVAKDAQKTQAFQTNRNICGSKEARIWTKPQLEIYADDVKCSHGSTVGQLDQNALFYLRSRGIGEKEAKLLLKTAFAHDVIESIRLEPLKDRLKTLIEKRFRGELAKCSGCSICN